MFVGAIAIWKGAIALNNRWIVLLEGCDRNEATESVENIRNQSR
jgi:hypothetical protein